MTTELLLTGFGGVVVLLLTLAGFLFNRWMQDMKDEISTLCQENKKEHEDIWERMHHHGHKIKAENGGYATAGVLTPEGGR